MVEQLNDYETENLELVGQSATELPADLDKFSAVKTLNFSKNCIQNLKGFPAAGIATLSSINLSDNQLCGSLNHLEACANLEELKLGNNKISSLEELEPLKKCTKLTSLDLSGCDIQQQLGEDYRNQVLGLLPQLTSLDGKSTSMTNGNGHHASNGNGDGAEVQEEDADEDEDGDEDDEDGEEDEEESDEDEDDEEGDETFESGEQGPGISALMRSDLDDDDEDEYEPAENDDDEDEDDEDDEDDENIDGYGSEDEAEETEGKPAGVKRKHAEGESAEADGEEAPSKVPHTEE